MPRKNRKRKAREAVEEEQQEEVFSVEKIVSKKVVSGKTQYLLKWRGYDSDENTWEPEENLDCQDLLDEFNRRTAKARDEAAPGSQRNNAAVISAVISAVASTASVTLTPEDKVLQFVEWCECGLCVGGLHRRGYYNSWGGTCSHTKPTLKKNPANLVGF